MKMNIYMFALALVIGISVSACDSSDEDTSIKDYFSDYREVIGYWDASGWNSIGLWLNADRTCEIFRGSDALIRRGTYGYDPKTRRISTTCGYVFTVEELSSYAMTCTDQNGNYHSFRARRNIVDSEYWGHSPFFDIDMNRKLIIGVWKNMATDTVLTFYADGRFKLVNGSVRYDGSYSWSYSDNLVLDCGLFAPDDQEVHVLTFLGTRLELSHGYINRPTYEESLLNGNYDYVFPN